MISYVAGIFFLVGLSVIAAAAGRNVLKLPSEASRFFDEADDSVGTRWAVLLAGSNGYWNYRHQVIIMTIWLLENATYLFSFEIYTFLMSTSLFSF